MQQDWVGQDRTVNPGYSETESLLSAFAPVLSVSLLICIPTGEWAAETRNVSVMLEMVKLYNLKKVFVFGFA